MKNNPEELFNKLINDQISREEFEELLVGLDDEGINARYEIFLQEQFDSEIEKYLGESAEVKQEKNTPTISNKKKEENKNKEHRLSSSYPLAAVFVVLLGLIFSVLFIVSQSEADSNSEYKSIAKLDAPIISKTTPRGRTFRLNLGDGSSVHLNAASSISYPNAFGEDQRRISLKGEAFLNVKRDENRPFIIDVKGYQVEVLGTSFNVQAYEDEDDFSVTVATGSVKVNLDRSGKNSAILEKNQKLTYNPVTKVTEIVEIDIEDELSWRMGILHFDATPMAKVEKMLERWYGIDLVIGNAEIYNKSLSGIHHNENIKSVIEALTYATGTTYQIKGNSIILKN